ncbi:MAG: Lrp/AsnC ligand binding domain-containing protein [Elusimicrobiales bacterium]|nr:Lrp/AsnC ligand binding domain-containing protein [Elusimicrobiales bacterium]
MIAFILVKLTAGLEQKAVAHMKAIPSVKDVYLTFGGWDAIIVAETSTMDKLSSMVIREVRGIHGVQSTETFVTTSL